MPSQSMAHAKTRTASGGFIQLDLMLGLVLLSFRIRHELPKKDEPKEAKEVKIEAKAKPAPQVKLRSETSCMVKGFSC